MNAPLRSLSFVTLAALAACVPPRQQQQTYNPPPQPTYAQPAPTYAQPAPTYTAPAPTAAPTYAQPTPTYTAPAPTFAPPPVATTPPIAIPTAGGVPTIPTTLPTALPGKLTLPGVCIPIGSWTKKFDNNLPASGTVDIGTPVVFNQFPVSDGVVVATMPVGTLKGVGAMTSTNDLSVDVSSGGYVLSYTCKFGGTGCNEGVCTTTKGGLGGFRLIKK